MQELPEEASEVAVAVMTKVMPMNIVKQSLQLEFHFSIFWKKKFREEAEPRANQRMKGQNLILQIHEIMAMEVYFNGFYLLDSKIDFT